MKSYIFAAVVSVLIIVAATAYIIIRILKDNTNEHKRGTKTVSEPFINMSPSPAPVKEKPLQASPEFQAICDKVKKWYEFDIIRLADGTEISVPRKRSYLFYLQPNCFSTCSCSCSYESETDYDEADEYGHEKCNPKTTVDEIVDEINYPFYTEEERKLVKQIEENNDFIMDACMASELGWI